MGDTEHLTNVDATQPVDVEDAPLVPDAERFDRIGTLGKGGMGEVRLFRDRRISRFVAQKVLHKKLQGDVNYRERFLLEARVQGQLEHPAIVPVHDLGETDEGELFFSMKCVRGVTLRRALESIRRGAHAQEHSRRRLLTAFSSVCLAVDFAHARGVVHRDLKPENVMLGQFGEVYVLDWGIAKVMHRADTPLAEVIDVPDHAATHAGAVLGTPKYMAPERQHGVANPATDVFALGTILGEILAAHGDDVPPELEAIQLRATALNASERYPTARALHDALESFLDGDRDLEKRKQMAEAHAARAAEALARGDMAARSQAGQEIGRALGLDPDNRHALQTLMKLLTDVPAELPPAAVEDMDRRRLERHIRTQRLATVVTLSMLLLIPLIVWMGVRSAALLAAFAGIVLTGGVIQYFFASQRISMHVTLAMLLVALSLLTTSLGMTGVVPAAAALIMVIWRMNVEKTIHGVFILLVAAVWLFVPFWLARVGVMAANYDVREALGTFGVVGVGLIYSRFYVNELRRADHRISFQAWQLQQLVPPER